MDDTEFFPDSYDIGEVAGCATIVSLNRDAQEIVLSQNGDGVVVLDLPALAELMTILGRNIHPDTGLIALSNYKGSAAYGLN